MKNKVISICVVVVARRAGGMRGFRPASSCPYLRRRRPAWSATAPWPRPGAWQRRRSAPRPHRASGAAARTTGRPRRAPRSSAAGTDGPGSAARTAPPPPRRTARPEPTCTSPPGSSSRPDLLRLRPALGERRRRRVLVHHLIAGVPLDGAEAGVLGDLVLDNRAVQVVGAEVERELGDRQPVHHPEALDVRDVVEQ